MLDSRDLRVFKEVAEQGSFSAAAQALDYTQPAISQRIQALERQTGGELFERTPRGARLTHAGEVLLAHADAILARLAQAEADLEAISDLRQGRVRIVSFPTAGSSLIPRAAGAFRQRHPEVELEITVAEPVDAVARLEAGEVDVAVLIESGFEPESQRARTERVHLLDDPMFVVMPPDHPLAHRRALELAELAGESWMHDGSGCPDALIFRRACRQAGFEPDVAFENDDYQAIQGFVAAGAGISLIPELALQSVRSDVVVRPLAGSPPVRHVVAAVAAGRSRAPATAAMLEVLGEVSAEYAASRGTDRSPTSPRT